MAWFLFIDESGHDRKASPYEVLAGVAVQDRFLWILVNELHEAELAIFGRRYSAGNDELKGLALAKLKYVETLFNLCKKYFCRVFASVVETSAPSTASGGLRKDYAYLFERFFYFLQDYNAPEPRSGSDRSEQGIIVFDELEKTKSHLLIDQTHRYFKDTGTGRTRAALIVRNPFSFTAIYDRRSNRRPRRILYLVGLQDESDVEAGSNRPGPVRSANCGLTV